MAIGNFAKIFSEKTSEQKNILIMSRTQMGGGNICIGGFDIDKKNNVRLLTSSGGNQPGGAPFQIGQIWRIAYTPKSNLTAPHTEDVMIHSSQLSNTLSRADITSFINTNCNIISGPLNKLFGGSIKSPLRAASYIDNSSVPNHSVCFWKPNSDLTHTNTFNKDKYHYEDQSHDTYFPYVGLVPAASLIPQGSIVRISLARWWTSPSSISQACYLQISGWY